MQDLFPVCFCCKRKNQKYTGFLFRMSNTTYIQNIFRKGKVWGTWRKYQFVLSTTTGN